MEIAVAFIIFFFVLILFFGTKKREKKSPVWLQILLGLFAGFLFIVIFMLVEFGFDVAKIFEKFLMKLAG